MVFVIFFNTTFLIQCFYYCMGLNMRNEIIVIAYNLNIAKLSHASHELLTSLN